ncbi:MAG: type IV secretion system DNA-binding domain-containing protein [Gloeocapsa sp. UFS-A4-WI-NPMV-4B04]|jgi:type IV secretory pathway TraG/TraD family ATPase VirD4|nr:type IV secretion system DNA-binding domain-containing protein [Gloeocapsa sp. UFS-A4-WI-NPMV-4B04]
MPQHSTTQPTQFIGGASTQSINSLVNSFKSGNGLILLCCLVGFIALSILGDGKKGKLSKGRFGKGREKGAAQQQSIKQMRSPQPNSVSLYIGRPSNSPFEKQPLYLPDAQRGIAVCGGPGSGKTFSVIDPAIRSAIDQGFPAIVYDFKYPAQTQRLIGYAASRGYNVRIFAPGYPESEVCNPLDFLNSSSDSLMARQIAEVMNKNFKMSNQSVEDSFFTQAGDQLTEAILMLAKGSKYADVMMCQALLSMEALPQRLMARENELDPWVRTSFGQLISVAQSERTVASIIATANANFTKFMKGDLLGSFCGKSTIPLDLEGKQLLVLGLDREKRDVVGPLLATVLHMIVNRNVTKRRKDPLILALDELPTLYLPALVHWLNENREDGLVCLLGFQNLVQLEKAYGKELARAILGGCATKAIFNPQEYDSARMFSDFLGEQEINYKQKSRGRSGGKASTNISDQERTIKLFESSQFLKLPTGKCILISPGFQSKGESSLPVEQKIKLSKSELAAVERSKNVWKHIRDRLIKRSSQSTITKENLSNHYKLVEQMFPKIQPGSQAKVEVDEQQVPDAEKFAEMM